MSAWLAVALMAYDPTTAAGAASGVLLSPDLDVDDGYYGIHVVRVVFGDAAAKAWRLYWLPYAAVMPHRSVWSHFPLASTIIRVAYALAPVAIMAAGLGRWSAFVAAITGEAMLRFVSGLALADALHVAADVIVSAWRRMW